MVGQKLVRGNRLEELLGIAVYPGAMQQPREYRQKSNREQSEKDQASHQRSRLAT